MLRAATTGVLVLATMALVSAQANSAARNFFSPSVLGDRIAFCTTSSEVCGKPIADAWCSHQGFDEAILFQREQNLSKSAKHLVRFADSGEICTGDQCKTFRQIKCYSAN